MSTSKSTPPRRRPRVKVAEAAKTGDRLATLEAMRDNLAADMDEPGALGIRPQISAQLRAVLADIAELKAAVEPEPESTGDAAADEVARMRDARRAATGG